MKTFRNIENLNRHDDVKNQLRSIIEQFIPIRKDKEATIELCSLILKSDVLLNKWKDENRFYNLNPHLEKPSNLDRFEIPESAVSPEYASSYKQLMLEVLKDDKISFGYLYHELASEQNRIIGDVCYECVFDHKQIEFEIDFDIDEIGKELSDIADLRKKFQFISKKEIDSFSKYPEYNSKFIEYATMVKRQIKDDIELFGRSNENHEVFDINSINDYIKILPAMVADQPKITINGQLIDDCSDMPIICAEKKIGNIWLDSDKCDELVEYFFNSLSGVENERINRVDDILKRLIKKQECILKASKDVYKDKDTGEACPVDIDLLNDRAMYRGFNDQLIYNIIQAAKKRKIPVTVWDDLMRVEPDVFKDDYEEYQKSNTSKAKEADFPVEIAIGKDTERAVKAISKAIEKGYIKEIENGYEWQKTKAQLGYFLHKAYNPDGCQTIPYKRLQSLFSETRLDSTIDKAINPKTPQKWRDGIDSLFTD